MITKGLEDKFLKYMYKRHISSQGYGVRNLEESKMLITSGSGIELEIPEILIEVDDERGKMKKYLVAQVAFELEHNGYVQFSNDNTYFWLTERGYRRAEQGWFQRVVGYFNKNPGLSIPIALSAVIISIIALIVTFFKD